MKDNSTDGLSAIKVMKQSQWRRKVLLPTKMNNLPRNKTIDIYSLRQTLITCFYTDWINNSSSSSDCCRWCYTFPSHLFCQMQYGIKLVFYSLRNTVHAVDRNWCAFNFHRIHFGGKIDKSLWIHYLFRFMQINQKMYSSNALELTKCVVYSVHTTRMSRICSVVMMG